jgi:glyoxalase family protein
MAEPRGVHHVTAVGGDPQRNIDFYLTVLGLRLVKQTVNFDAPDTFHLYYGDEQGTPGTILTFFPWPGAPRGRRGTGQATTTSFSVPPGSIGWWRDHLANAGVGATGVEQRFEEEVLRIEDPDGLALELVAHAGDERAPWDGGPLPAEHAIRGFHSVAFCESGFEATAHLLSGSLGFRLVDEAGGRFRFGVGDAGPAQLVDVLVQPEAQRGRVAAGTVHHVAWRAPDDDTQRAWREELVGQGLDVTPVLDRSYFRSIYFREPGGVLLEIATDVPGFTVDEPVGELGRRLRLPPWLESRREEIEQGLAPLKVPDENWPAERRG